jgi:nucleoside-diphosphate-sugar epimerase
VLAIECASLYDFKESGPPLGALSGHTFSQGIGMVGQRSGSPRAAVLVTGATGQIGTELTCALRRIHGADRVITSGIEAAPASAACPGPYVPLDVTDAAAVEDLIAARQIDVVYHLAAILSATGEKNPQAAWNVNVGGLENVLEAARKRGVRQIFAPSSIAVFGPETPRTGTPQDTVMRPRTIYGVAKVTGELLCDYYVQRYGLDVRGVRYPGVISSGAPPGGGTTDYAVAMFYAALRGEPYVCFVREDTVLPMIYMPDCLKAAIDLMRADRSRLRHHNAFNVAAVSFSAGELAAEIRRHVPGFVCEYEPDGRQAIADSWPHSVDDSAARCEWDWKPDYDLEAMVADMIGALRHRRVNEERTTTNGE